MARTLNATQLSVLCWIANGCPDGIMAGYSHRISASALRSRGLVVLSGHGPSWRAEITDRGRQYLSDHTSQSSGTLHIAAAAPAAVLSPTEQLIADLIEAGGTLDVPAWPARGERDYRALVSSAQRFGKVPSGRRLLASQVRDRLKITLEDAIPGTLVEAQPVPVPDRLTRPHPAAKRFRDQTDHHEVSRVALPRCTRIVHALATEAERRGMGISNVVEQQDRYGRPKWSGGNDGHLAVAVRGHEYRLRFAEEKVPARKRWEQQASWRSWTSHGERKTTRRYDANATGRLTITLLHGSRGGRAASWSDRNAWTLEEKLPELLRELEVRAAEDDHARLEAQRAAEERQRLWEIEIDRAKSRFVEAHRAKVLHSQIAAWQAGQAATAYLEALRQAHGDSPEAAEWLAWINNHIEQADPLRSVPRMPEQPEIGPEDLKPFMPSGMNPYGPARW